MSGFDDEEYESFELDGSRRTAAVPQAVAPDDDTDDDPDDEAADEEATDEVVDDEAADDEDLDDEDDYEDATDDEVDFVLAAYREDGQPMVQALAKDLANDLEELVAHLRRLPGDAGALGFVSLLEEVFVLVRVRGPRVQVLLSDAAAAADWPICRDVADLLGEDVPDPEEDTEPLGDLGIVADLGVSDLDLTAITEDVDLGSDQQLLEIADMLKIGPQFRRVAEAALAS